MIAIIRLGAISQQRGNFTEAADLYKDALGVDDSYKNAWIMLGLLDLKNNAFRPARGSFERVLRKHDSHDIYCLLLSGYLLIFKTIFSFKILTLF